MYRLGQLILTPNTSAQIWGEDVLEPERWLSPLPDTVVNSSLPGIYSHKDDFFWGGSSACPGYVSPWNIRSSCLINWLRFQFGLLELKVVILLLLSAFKFSLADEEIVWRSSGLQFPSVAETGSLGLPLKVEAF